MPFIHLHKKPGDFDAISLGLTLGIITSASVFFLGLISTLTGFGAQSVSLIGDLYKGFSDSLIGSVIGAVYGFIDGFIGGTVIAFLYNFIKNRRR